MTDIGQLSSLLEKTLDTNPTNRAGAEQQLTSLSTSNPSHISTLLQIIAAAESPIPIRLAAAIHLKNIIRSRWDADDAHDAGLPVVDEGAKAALRENLLPLLLSLSHLNSPAPLPLRLQLNTSLSLVASHDFPRLWTGLLDDIISNVASPNADLGVVQACFSTLHEVTKSWRGQFRSDKLYEEINFVLGKFAPLWWTGIQATHQALLDPSTPASQFAPLLSILHTYILLFYDLSCQDLPPLFEDNIAPISELLLHWLSYTPESSRLPPNDDDDKPDELTKVRAAVCEAAELYAQRYLDAWEPQVAGFVQAVWEMLGKLEGKTGGKYDGLLSKALSFLSVIVRQPSLRHLFSSAEGGAGVMESLVQRVILPNVGMKESEEEMFEDEPLAWVKREVEGSTETDTPRLSSLAFLRSLLEHFTQEITGIISRYIQTYLEQYTANPPTEWRKKDAAIWLMTGVAAKGSTGRHGVSQASTNSLVDVVDFFSNHIFADLQASEGSVNPILKVDAIRYLHTFRNQLTKEQLLSVLPLLVHHLQSDNVGIATYASIAVESILVIRGPNNSMLFTPEDVQTFAEPTLLALFGKIEAGETPEKVAENEFYMKGVMRVLTTGREQVASKVHSVLLDHLAKIISIIAKNPSNPRFSQFAFESVAALVRYALAADPASIARFEELLFPPFTAILQQEVAEFVPFVFQLLSQLLEARQSQDGQLPASYQSLLPSLLTPTLWQSRGNVPALVRLMQAYLTKASAAMVANNQISPVLGIYQQLIASRINDEFGFELMQTVFETVDESALQPFKSAVMTLMLTRLQNSRTDKFVRGFVGFVASLALIRRKGNTYPEATFQAFDSVQPGLFTQLVQGIIAAEVPKTTARRKPLVVVGLGRLLTESPSMLTSEALAPVWAPLLGALVTLSRDSSIAAKSIEAQQAEADEVYAEEWEEQNTFQAGFSKLAASAPRGTEARDVVAVREVMGADSGKDVGEWLVEQVVKASQRQPGRLQGLLAGMDPKAGQAMQAMLAQKGLNIA